MYTPERTVTMNETIMMGVKTVSRIAAPVQMPRLKRVAAYARVSMGKDAMLHSLAAQVSYYSDLIQRNPEWEYAGVYADEGLTGTKENRPEFQRMLSDCRAGKIDMILVKSISRFARNTVTLLETARVLKEMGISVYFEEQKIDTMSGGGELMLSILASSSADCAITCICALASVEAWLSVSLFSMVSFRIETASSLACCLDNLASAK